MSDTMDPAGTGSAAPSSEDLSPLAWVHGELRRSLESAHKSLRRYLKEAEAASGSDVDDVDPAVLRSARNQLHQGVGALELVGMPAVADVLRASESAVQRMCVRPAMVNLAAVETVERVSFALLDFLSRQLARKAVSPVMLFPQYRAALQLAGAERIHPADLWKVDWQWLDLPPDGRASPRTADDTARTDMESLVLDLLRQSRETVRREPLAAMSQLCAELGEGARQASPQAPHLSSFWQLAAAVFEAQADGLLVADTYCKRIASRLLAQLRMRVRGQGEISDRFAQDLLFFCGQALRSRPPAAPAEAVQPGPRLAAVAQAWQLDHKPTADYDTPRLGRFDPALLTTARKRVAAAKDAWSAVAGGELHRLNGLSDQFSLVGDSLQRLMPAGEQLAQALQLAATQTVASAGAPSPTLAMEVATAILYLDASLEDGEFDHPELAERVHHLASRIDDVRVGAEPQPLDAWMEELYRRVSDRQTMGSVVQELRASLSEAEKLIDQYFRDPSQRQCLIPVPGQLSAMRGVLSVLGMDQASQAALHMRDEVHELAETEADPERAAQTGTFDRLADNLGALSFLIDMLSVQPQLAKSLFHFDAESGSLIAVMGQRGRSTAVTPSVEPSAQAAAPVPAPEAEGSASASPAVASAASTESSAPSASPAPAAAPSGTSGLEDDAEMREVFIEEAREVIAEARDAIARMVDSPDSAGDMTTVRRAFHTLKGSSRMVGLREFGDAGWACEQLYNARLAADAHMDGALRHFTTEALNYLGDWTEAIADGVARGHEAGAISRSADALRLTGEQLPVSLPPAVLQQPEAPAIPKLPELPELPEPVLASDPIPSQPAPTEPPAAPEAASFDTIPLPVIHPSDPWDASPEGSDPLAPTLAFPVLPDPAPAAAQPVDLGLDLDLDSDDPAPDDALTDADFALQPQVSDELSDLTLRVPDLPSAADLDLTLPALQAAPDEPPSVADGAPDVAGPAERRLELDLSALDGPELLSELPLDAPLETRVEALAHIDLPDVEAVEIDPDELERVFATEAYPPQPPAAEADPAPSAGDAPSKDPESEDEEPVKVIGPLRIGIPLFNIYLNEADELSRRLCTELAEWSHEHELHPVPESSAALAHSLAGNSATVGYVDLSALARALEHALTRSHAHGHGRPGETALFSDAAEEVRRLLHQFAAGFLKPVSPELMERLAEHERLPLASSEPLPIDIEGGEGLDRDLEATVDHGSDLAEALRAMTTAPSSPQSVVAGPDALDVPGVIDRIDPELFGIFEEEAEELLPQLQSQLRAWLQRPSDPAPAMACMRSLHTIKGGARLAGAMRLGEMAHRLEAEIERLSAQERVSAEEVEPLLAHADAMSAAFDALRQASRLPQAQPEAEAPALPEPADIDPLSSIDGRAPADADANADAAVAEADAVAAEPLPSEATLLAGSVPDTEGPQAPALEVLEALGASEAPVPEVVPAQADAPAAAVPRASPVAPPVPAIDWSRFATEAPAIAAAPERTTASTAVVRVRAGLLDRLVNQAGEVSITRARIDSDVKQLQGALGELTESLDRMRRQLRDIELQAETQISSRMEAAKAASQAFDPLEMDRFTRFQELTRFMAESVNDVATLQRSLQRTLQSTEDQLAAQARLTRELQDDLLRTRMIEFESMADRLFRTARGAARETGKQVRLEIVGGAIEIDRGVLERMAGSFEHLLRNSVVHGIEAPEQRSRSGKEAAGLITITVEQSGNEVAVEFADDGAGLDLARIKARALARGLMAPDAEPSDTELANLIFQPGFSTADTVTELAGRGVGMDVVRSEVNAMGGRIETLSEAGQGTRFRLLLPLTTAVTQVVMLRCGEQQVAVPSPLIELVRRVGNEETRRAYLDGNLEYAGEQVPFYWLSALLGTGSRGESPGRTQTVVIVRSANQRVAVHVDEVIGSQEVVVKNVGPQLARLPGLAGVTLLPSGSVALIYNPVALASLYGSVAWSRMRQQPAAAAGSADAAASAVRAPLVLVVDDSLTVRRITQRMLVREGYRVVTAKDGLEALEKLAEERPVVVLSDIEMPRMDGFDLLRNVRSDPRLAGLPVVMITSRIAQKHRDYAAELGVDHYLGKPYAEEELLAIVARHAGAAVPA
jgi:chemosensory pili system protein ChpA (sensor histidine kinase/response regulator)